MASAMNCPVTAPAKGVLTPIPTLQNGRIPVILVHGNHSEDNDPNCAGWSALIEYFGTPGNDLSQIFSLYLFVHDSSKPIGFDGNSGNSLELGQSIDALFPRDQKIVIIAHSRGGLVSRAFMNRYGDGSEGNRVLLLLTLATPHHGTPLAVADWGLLAIKNANIFNAACIVNVEYGLTDNENTLCKAPFLKTQAAFNINRAGSKDLRWDNFDGPEFGIDYSPGFSVGFPASSVEVGNPHTLSLLDAGLQGAVLPPGEADNDLHGHNNPGALEQLNNDEKYTNKIIAYGGYYTTPILNASLGDYAVSNKNQHVGLSFASKILAAAPSKNETVSLFEANDGLVPLQSALFLRKDSGDEPLYKIERDCFFFCSNEIIYPLEIKDLKARIQVKDVRVFQNYDHLDLLEGNGSDEQLFDSIKADLLSAAVSQLPPTAGFAMSAENQTATDGQTLQLSAPLGKSVAVTFDAGSSVANDVGTIQGWTWKIDGAVVSSQKTFSFPITFGLHQVALSVREDLGTLSSEVTASIVVDSQKLSSTLLFDASQDPKQRFFFASIQTPITDSQGNLLFVSTHFGFSCPFGQCGIRVNSIAALGTLNWQTPNDGSFLSFNVEGSITIGENDHIYVPGFAATLFSLDSTGVATPGWPVLVGPQHFQGPIIADQRLGTVYASGATTFSFSDFPATIMAINPDGTVKWRDDFPNGGRLNLYQGPNRDLYTLLGATSGTTLSGFDHGSGVPFCSPTVNLDSLASGPEGLFGSLRADIFIFDANCNSTRIFTSTDPSQVVAYADKVIYALNRPNPNDAAPTRLFAITNTGAFLWIDSRIQLPVFQAAKNGLVYLFGRDTQDNFKSKIFVLNSTTGEVLDNIETSNICNNCDLAITVADDGTFYVTDQNDAKIFRMN